jgi:hypothetical protein
MNLASPVSFKLTGSAAISRAPQRPHTGASCRRCSGTRLVARQAGQTRCIAWVSRVTSVVSSSRTAEPGQLAREGHEHKGLI